MAEEKIEKISAVTRKSQASGSSPIQEAANEPDPARFNEILEQKPIPTPVAQQETAGKPSVIEHVASINSSGGTNPQAPDQAKLFAQTQSTLQTVEKAKETLARSEVQLSAPVQRLMRNKLTHVDDNLKIALSKVGVEYTPPGEITNLNTPINRFIGMLTNAQTNLASMGSYLEGAAASGRKLSPADMLSIQLKISVVQQELELFISLLSKALEATKTIMNVQV